MSKQLFKQLILPFIAMVILFSIWEVLSRFFVAYQFMLPPPTAILERVWVKADRFWLHTQVTLLEMAGGFLLAFVVAFPLAWLMAWSKSINFMLHPLFIAIQCVPMFALAPIMVFWFGWTYQAIVIPTALMIFFPLTLNIYQGLKSTPTLLLDYFRINQASQWQIFFKLQLPWALPHIFAGIRLSAAIAGIGAVAGEWAGAQYGLGPLMIESRRATDLETTFGALFCLALISLTLYALIAILERMVINPAMKTGAGKAIIGIIVALSSLTSCQHNEEAKNQTRLLLDWCPNPNHIPLYVGIDKGFFSQKEIYLVITKLHDPSDSVPYLTSGQAQLSLFYMPDIIRSMNRGAEIEPVGIIFKKPLNSIIYRSNRGIEKPADLTGKIIGYCSDGTATQVLDYLMKHNQAIPKSKQNVSFDMAGALGTGLVDAIYGAYWNIECEHLRSLGIETGYFDLIQLGYPTYYELIVLAKKGSKESQPLFLSAFQSSLQESIHYCKTFPEEAFDIYRKANPDKSDHTYEWELSSWMKTYPHLTSDQHFDSKTWSELAQWIEVNKF